jgi:hypothetical protein
MKRFKKQIGHQIQGGFHYHIPDGPTIMSESVIPEEALDDLCDQVTAYRVNNGLPSGSPVDEITDWYAEHFPFCVENGEREEPKKQDELTLDIINWTNRQWKLPPKALVDTGTAHRRQERCLGCKFRDNVIEDSSPAGKEAKRRLFLLSRGMLLGEETGWCIINKWDNRLACFLPNPEIRESYSKCWIDKPTGGE